MRFIVLLTFFISTHSYSSCYMGELDPSIMTISYSDVSKYQKTDKRKVDITLPTYHDLAGGGKDSGKVIGIYITKDEPYFNAPLQLIEVNGITSASFTFQQSELFKGYKIVAAIDYKWDQPYPSRCTAHNVVAELEYNQALNANGQPQAAAH